MTKYLVIGVQIPLRIVRSSADDAVTEPLGIVCSLGNVSRA